MQIILLIALIFLNGLLAMAEIALITARKSRLQRMIDQGDPAAALVLKLGEDPTNFLSTVQIGLTSIGILNGIVGQAALARPLAQTLQQMNMEPVAAEYTATAVIVLMITYFSIVLGELVPKRLAQTRPEAIARLVARPMVALNAISKPFVKLLAGSTSLVLRAFGIKHSTEPSVTEEDIHALLVEGSNAGIIELHEHTMVRNIFRLDDRQIASLMVPRGEVTYLNINAPLEENLRIIEQSRHSRFPLVKDSWDEILGVVNVRKLMVKMLHGQRPDLEQDLEPPVYVPESLTGMELLQNFRSSGGELAFVIDEYGQVLGIVTLQDVVEALMGEFKPQNAEDAWAVQREDGSWLLDGLIPIPELKDRIGIKSVPEEDKERYHTLSGMMMLLLGRLPQTTDHVEWEGWRFEIVDMDGKRIDKVLAMPIAPSDPGEEEPPAA